MSVQPTPPIQLDPSMDTGHQLAFINQNFNNIASVLSKNSFVIVQSGTISLNATSAVAGNTITSSITHNLGYVPAALAYFTDAGATTYYSLPMSTSLATAAPGIVTFNNWIYYTATTSQFFISYFAGATGNYGTFNFKYFLLQQTAN